MSEDIPVLDVLTAPTAHEFLRSRRSIRHYRADHPPRRVLERMFASVVMAPSAHNRQPWRFLVITEHLAKVCLARAMGARLMLDRGRDGDHEDAVQADVARSFARITQAPVVIMVALTMRDMDRYPDDSRARAEFLMAVQSTAMAAQNLLLAAHAEGLGACWMCAPLFCPADAAHALTLPDDWQPQGLITLGVPSGPGRLKTRKRIEDVVVFGGDAGRERPS